MKITIPLILSLLIFFSQKTQAQKADNIYLKNGDILPVNVVKTKGESVRYKAYSISTQKHKFTLPKTDIDKIVYYNGIIEYYGGQALQYPRQKEGRSTDIMYLKDSSQMKAKILSIEGDSIKCRQEESYTRRIFIASYPKNEIEKIIYRNGLIDYFTSPAIASTQLEAQQKKQVRDSIRTALDKKKNIFKVTPVTFLAGYTTFAYERRISESESIEVKLGIIGMGNINEKDIPQKGFYTSIGYKWVITPPEKYRQPRHLLHGVYIRPELAIGRYQHLFTNEIFRGGRTNPEIQQGVHKISYSCMVFNLGKQWISNPLVLDIFTGLGFGHYSQSEGSAGIVNRTRYAYRMNIKDKSGSASVKIKLGLYLGFIF